MEWRAGRASIIYYKALPKHIHKFLYGFQVTNHNQNARLFRLYGSSRLRVPIFEFTIGSGGAYVYYPPAPAMTGLLDVNMVEEVYYPQDSSISK